MTDVLDANPDIDEPAVPAEDPAPQAAEQRQYTFPELFAKNYQDIVERLLSSSNSFNKIDNQQLRLKAVEVAERLTYWQFGGSPR
jgi:hypothetical protein